MNLRIWTWKRNARIRRLEDERERHVDFVEALSTVLQRTQVTHNMHVTYAKRPPAPRPERITIIWRMMDGQEYRQYIPLNGNSMWTESIPHYVQTHFDMANTIEFHVGYADGSLL